MLPTALFQELVQAPKGSDDLEKQREEWLHAIVGRLPLHPLDTYMRGCIARDIQDARGVKGDWSGLGQDELADEDIPF
jgi:hypothetical protein